MLDFASSFILLHPPSSSYSLLSPPISSYISPPIYLLLYISSYLLLSPPPPHYHHHHHHHLLLLLLSLLIPSSFLHIAPPLFLYLLPFAYPLPSSEPFPVNIGPKEPFGFEIFVGDVGRQCVRLLLIQTYPCPDFESDNIWSELISRFNSWNTGASCCFFLFQWGVSFLDGARPRDEIGNNMQ